MWCLSRTIRNRRQHALNGNSSPLHIKGRATKPCAVVCTRADHYHISKGFGGKALQGAQRRLAEKKDSDRTLTYELCFVRPCEVNTHFHPKKWEGKRRRGPCEPGPEDEPSNATRANRNARLVRESALHGEEEEEGAVDAALELEEDAASEEEVTPSDRKACVDSASEWELSLLESSDNQDDVDSEDYSEESADDFEFEIIPEDDQKQPEPQPEATVEDRPSNEESVNFTTPPSVTSRTVYIQGELNNGVVRRAWNWCVKKLPFGHSWSSHRYQYYAKNTVVNKRFFGLLKSSHTKRSVDAIRELGYGAGTDVLVYENLLETVAREPKWRGQNALTAENKINPNYIRHVNELLKIHLKDTYKQLDPEILSNTILWFTQKESARELRMRHGTTKDPIPHVYTKGDPVNGTSAWTSYILRLGNTNDPIPPFEINEDRWHIPIGRGWRVQGDKVVFDLSDEELRIPGSGKYMTMYSGFHSNIRTASASVHNLFATFLNRIGGNRPNEELLRANHKRNVPKLAIILRDYLDELSNKLGREMICEDRVKEYVFSRKDWPKRAFYLKAIKDLEELGPLGAPFNGSKKNTLKVKTMEVLPKGKQFRAIVDLDPLKAIQGMEVVDQFKKILAKSPLITGNNKVVFVTKAEYTTLLEAVQTSIDLSPFHNTCYVFSDDALVITPTKVFNVDISKCDKGMYEEAFALLGRAFASHGAVYQNLVDQLLLPLVFDIPHSLKGLLSVICFPKSPFLASGSVLTTILNSIMNGCVLSQLPLDCSITQIIKTGEKFGIIYKVELCNQRQDMQFLKHSPAKDFTELWHPVLNFGVVLRALGKAKGDIPGNVPGRRVSLKVRAGWHMHSVLKSAYPRFHIPMVRKLMTNLERDYGVPPESFDALVREKLNSRTDNNEAPPLYFSNDAILARYNLSPSEISTLERAFTSLRPLRHRHSKVVEKILAKDYGIPPLGWDDEEQVLNVDA